MRYCKPFLATFFCLVWLVCLSAIALAAAPPAITADAAIIVDAASGEVLYEKNADKREYPASTTKMMTCILALESGRMERIVQISDSAADVESTELYAGNQLRLKDLLFMMMLDSDNGAATATGETLAAGDIVHFAKLMNQKAKELGMSSTHFVNANGMPDPNHYTTARDMSKLFLYALKNKEFRKIIGTQEKNVYFLRPAGESYYCENTNELLYSYPGCIGGKTGWTMAARGCLAVAAGRDGRELLTVVLHSEDGETRFEEAAALLDYGFALPRKR